MFNTILLLTLVGVVAAHDVIVGTNTEGRKIFDDIRQASPAIWRQAENVTINTTDAEVISRVVVTDLRPDKDGDVKIVDGGEGQKNVTFELKSPTALRGYDFRIEVFSIPEDKFKPDDKTVETPNPSQTRVQRNPLEDKPSFNIPPSVLGDTKNSESSTAKANPTPISDTKLNEDKTKPIEEASEDVNQFKLTIGKGSAIVPGNTPVGVPTPAVTIRNNEEAKDSHDHNRHARDALDAAKTDNKQQATKSKQNDGNNENLPKINTPVITSPGAFGRYPQPANNDKTESDEGKRNARDAVDSKIGDNNNMTPKTNAENSSLRPAHPRFSSDSRFVSQPTNKDQIETTTNSNDGKREARDTENDTKSSFNNSAPKTNVKNSSVPPVHPRISLDPPTVSQLTTDDVQPKDEKRDARDTENGKTSDNLSTTPKTTVENSSIPPAHPKISSDSTPSIVRSSIPKDDDDDTKVNSPHHAHFVPPPGYMQMVRVNSHMEDKDRPARDVGHDSDKPHPPLFTRNEAESENNEGPKTTLPGQSTTAKSTESVDSKRSPQTNVPSLRSQYPLPYSAQASSTESPTTVKQEKRETNTEDSETGKPKDGNLGYVPRSLGERNSTVFAPKPVISIQ